MAWRVLMVGAHPDDIEIAAAGTAARLSQRGVEVLAIIATDDTDRAIAATRRAETRDGLSELGLAAIEFLGLPDRAVDASVGAARLTRRLHDLGFEPDAVITHTPHDDHSDHRGVAAMVRTVVDDRVPILSMAVVNSLRPSFRPSIFVDTTEFHSAKLAALEAHRSQAALGRIRLQAIADLEASWAPMAGGALAEPFEYSFRHDPDERLMASLAPCRSIVDRRRTRSPLPTGT